MRVLLLNTHRAAFLCASQEHTCVYSNSPMPSPGQPNHHLPFPPLLLSPGPIRLSEKELQALRLSCGEFAWLSEHARGHLKAAREAAGDPGIFEQELDLADEMAQLQRRNIANLERKLREKQ